MSIKQTAAHILHKTWGPEAVRQYVGSVGQSYFAYAGDEVLRESAASGGVITALLDHALRSGRVDGALACSSQVIDGKVVPRFNIATTRADLLAAQGSKYSAVFFNRDALPLMRAFQGKLAVVALPCDLSNLRRLMESDAVLREKVVLVIGLLCGHNSRPELTELVVDKLRPQGATLTDFHYRQGHWRGELEARFDNGAVVRKPFSTFSDYQNLFYFSQQKCHHCHDHTGYEADISVGDVWSLRMKDDPIKHNAVIVRTECGAAAFEAALRDGAVVGQPEPIAEICEGQARSMPFHYNVSARAKAGRRLGLTIKDTVQAPVRWNDLLVARMALKNEMFSRGPQGRKKVARIPRFILKLMLYVMKGLESI
ncbi:MAG: coenzyme hydrogenase subunit beta [Chloroflexota bacterium]|nr:coenzyme hydrogenase subunit beta [Chloroflexota bacterium]